ncbi:MAG: oxygen-dependent coproporphyrinogen oxidase [Halobacteriovoraceae bacterium]|nr:oxygen-dependent coproporphyrinogen oxidase [Halobacteriovoraceae bacterium]
MLMKKERLDSLKNRFYTKVRQIQDNVADEIGKIDPSVKLIRDAWKRDDFKGNDGGGGLTLVFQGDVIENAGVNTSLVFGEVNPEFARNLKGKTSCIWASGVSIIIHPRSPRIPTVHANFRMINQGEETWFGGGADLTPYYPHLEDFRYFHQVWFKACKPWNTYSWMKKNCDRYFVNHHRKEEMRGIGGIFFDHYNTGDLIGDFEMVSHLADHFGPSYFPIAHKRKDESYSQTEEEFQLYRRGRYVEFNLLHDRGTHFGIKSGGRIESIFVSLPPRCNFNYGYTPPASHPISKMNSLYRPCDWADPAI